MTFLNADTKIATHAAVTTNVHGTGAGNTVVGDDELLPGVETGSLVSFGGGTAPSGYLLCNGAAISRTTYSTLFGVIGTLYGIGDGSTTFNIPNFAGKIPVGIGGSGVTNRGDTGGEQTHTLITSEMPAHTHTVPHGINTGNDYHESTAQTLSTPITSSSTGGGGAHQNMQPYVGTEYIIKT